jgi:predicted phage-related endonuclease
MALAIKDKRTQAAIRELRAIKGQQTALADRAKELERTIKGALGDAEEATVGGIKVVTYRTAIRRTVSLTLLRKAYPEIADECTVQSEVRTFKILEV